MHMKMPVQWLLSYKLDNGSYIFECLNICDTVEDDIETAWQYPRLVWLSSHGVCLARVGDTIGKQQPCRKQCQLGEQTVLVDLQLFATCSIG